jgi:hypothetical protein
MNEDGLKQCIDIMTEHCKCQMMIIAQAAYTAVGLTKLEIDDGNVFTK